MFKKRNEEKPIRITTLDNTGDTTQTLTLAEFRKAKPVITKTMKELQTMVNGKLVKSWDELLDAVQKEPEPQVVQYPIVGGG